jgi:hypothetical protein
MYVKFLLAQNPLLFEIFSSLGFLLIADYLLNQSLGVLSDQEL